MHGNLLNILHPLCTHYCLIYWKMSSSVEFILSKHITNTLIRIIRGHRLAIKTVSMFSLGSSQIYDNLIILPPVSYMDDWLEIERDGWRRDERRQSGREKRGLGSGIRNKLVTGQREEWEGRKEKGDGGCRGARWGYIPGDSEPWTNAMRGWEVDGQREGRMDGGDRRRGDRACLQQVQGQGQMASLGGQSESQFSPAAPWEKSAFLAHAATQETLECSYNTTVRWRLYMEEEEVQGRLDGGKQESGLGELWFRIVWENFTGENTWTGKKEKHMRLENWGK